MDYPISIRRLSEEDGGGYLVEVPDLPGCMSDGETPKEAFASGREAIEDWIETACREGRRIPRSGENSVEASAQLAQRSRTQR